MHLVETNKNACLTHYKQFFYSLEFSIICGVMTVALATMRSPSIGIARSEYKVSFLKIVVVWNGTPSKEFYTSAHFENNAL